MACQTLRCGNPGVPHTEHALCTNCGTKVPVSPGLKAFANSVSSCRNCITVKHPEPWQFTVDEIVTRCAHCHLPAWTHAQGEKCLFDATTYEIEDMKEEQKLTLKLSAAMGIPREFLEGFGPL